LLLFKAGKLKASLLTTVPAVRGTAPEPGLHHNAPTQGCTFQPTESVTFLRSASFPVISLIWYLARWLLRRSTPGASVSFFEAEVFFEALVLRFWFLRAEEVDLVGKKRWRRALNE
jgi:hypothetical protein